MFTGSYLPERDLSPCENGVRPKLPVLEAHEDVFISYLHAHEALKNELVKHLSAARRSGIIREWHDRQITPGADWSVEIDGALDRCGIILLLISADFIHSDYCYGFEMKRALERHRSDEAQVIPVILRSCDWTDLPFAQYQALPKDGRAVTSWPNPDEALTEIARGIRALASQRPSSAAPEPQTLSSPVSPQTTGGPELVVDYNYRENSKDLHDANAPLVIKNVSPSDQAYNIRVQPLHAEKGVLDFEPDLIPYIESGGSKNVFSCIKEGSPLFRRRLPDFLFQKYNDQSVEELFATRVFPLSILYEDVRGLTFRTSCELNFRP